MFDYQKCIELINLKIKEIYQMGDINSFIRFNFLSNSKIELFLLKYKYHSKIQNYINLLYIKNPLAQKIIHLNKMSRYPKFADEEGQQVQNDDQELLSDSDSSQNENQDQQSSLQNIDPNKKNNDEEQYNTLQELIMHLNEEDHSEDQGIEDYKIGGYHPCHVGQVLISRYVLVQKLGWGHFSTVWLAKDFKYGNYVAVKIMKSSPHYLEASYDQVEILQKVANKAYDPEWLKSLKDYEPNKTTFDRDDSHVLNLLNSFLYKGPYGNHFCMVFEILGVNLLEVLKRYDYKGLPLELVKEITRQVLMGLDFLNRICRVIHTDLKPENVLLCLTPEQIRTIVQDGQLASKTLYKDRLRLYRQKFGMGPLDQSDDQDNQSDSQPQYDPEIQARIDQLEERLEQQGLNANQRKNLRRKLKKWHEKGEQALQAKLKEKKIKEKQQPKPKQKKTAKQLFSAFDTKLVLDKGPKLQEGFKVKIADLGNACWQHHHFATEIQTRQYRGPQVLTGSKYNLSADMWSLACMTFEMLTGQLLFNPRKDNSETFGKNDDHLAQMMELLGRFPKKFSLRGVKSRKYYSKDGALQRIPKLQNWSLKDVMVAKYRFTDKEAEQFQKFMSPMLQCLPEKRLLPNDMLKFDWLTSKAPEYLLDHETHEKIKKERYDFQNPREQILQYESEKEDASGEDNATAANENEDDDQFYGYEKVGDIRYIDRSFMDLGYIGYGDGIFLDKLDAGPNWQFSS